MKFIKTKIILILFMFFFFHSGEGRGVSSSFAQNIGINTTGNAPNSSALLDVDASPGNNKGILIPRLPLTASNVGAPISPAPGAAEKGLMIYNTATAGISPNDVVPGFYYWNGSAWAPLGGGGSTGGGWTDDGTVVRLTTSTDFVGIGTVSPASTSALDITSTTKGILIPRMTTAQRDAIATPATGLQVYNIDCQTLNYWSGTCWISTSKAIPSPEPITSSGTTTFCAGQTRTYSIPAVPGATKYGWTVPAGTSITSGQGTTSINATFGNISGSVCVDASNNCETSPVRCLSVSVDPIPNTPGNITGITTINPGQQSVTFFVASVNGASTYTWSYSGTGFSIASGTGTTTIVVNFTCNATAGNISVTANSTCGASPASSLALTITPLLAASAGSPLFGGIAIGGSPTATGGTTAYAYSWNPATNLSSSTLANPIALCTGATTTYTVTVTDSRTCTATSSVVVTRNLTASAGGNITGPGAIGGAPTATGGAGSYLYSWTTASELSSSTVANPNAKACNTTTFTVTVTDANSCTVASSGVTVTRNLVASAGANQTMVNGCTKTIGGSPTATGGTGSYTYSWTGTNLSSTTIANPVSSVTSTITYTVTVTDGNGCTASSSMTLTVGGTLVTYTSSSTWTAPAGVTCISVIVVAGGGSGGNHNTTNANGGGGGGGLIVNTSYTVVPGNVYTVTIGAGGARIGNSTCGKGNNGQNSVFGTLTAIGGGGGASSGCGASGGGNGGSGGGAAYPNGNASSNSGGTGTGGQGNAGGGSAIPWSGAGGGGYGSAGVVGGSSSNNCDGGGGYRTSFSGSLVGYAGGGGGGGNSSEHAGDGWDGGGRGEGTTQQYNYNNYPVSTNGTTLGSSTPDALPNTGGGGGGGSYWACNGGWCNGSGQGGSGIVMLKY